MKKPSPLLEFVALTILGASLIYLSAKLSFPLPGTDVPQSAQTLAILVLAAVLPNYTGVYAVLLYLTAGTLGLPVFSDGGSGIGHLLGPTGGYLSGFLVAALLIAKIKLATGLKKPLAIISLMLAAHIIILLLGWLWLSEAIGFTRAFEKGLAPFIAGGVFKSLLAAGIIILWQKPATRRFIKNQSSQ